MNSENIVKNLRLLWRTDRIIAEMRLRHMLVSLGLRAFAALIAAFGLLILLSSLGVVAAHWQYEVALPDAPPSFMGPARAPCWSKAGMATARMRSMCW